VLQLSLLLLLWYICFRCEHFGGECVTCKEPLRLQTRPAEGVLEELSLQEAGVSSLPQQNPSTQTGTI